MKVFVLLTIINIISCAIYGEICAFEEMGKFTLHPIKLLYEIAFDYEITKGLATYTEDPKIYICVCGIFLLYFMAPMLICEILSLLFGIDI